MPKRKSWKDQDLTAVRNMLRQALGGPEKYATEYAAEAWKDVWKDNRLDEDRKEREAAMGNVSYRCGSFRPIRWRYLKVEGTLDAASIFATRMAKREFGSRGVCANVERRWSSSDGCRHDFIAFICHRQRSGDGHYMWFIVRVA